MKTKTKNILSLVATLFFAVLMAGFAASCSGDDDDDEKGGSALTPDPSIPVMSDIKYELSPKTVIVPETTARRISNVDTIRRKLTMPTTAATPEVGQCIIVNTPTADLPEGLLAKVTSVKETGNGYEVTYDYAELTEAFKSIEIPEQYIPLNDKVEHIYDMDGNEVAYSRGNDTRKSGIQPIELTLPEKALKFQGIEITPKMSIDLMMRYVLQAGDYQIDFAHCAIDGEVTVGGDLTLKKLKEAKLVEKYIPLVKIFFTPIPVGPIVLTPWTQLNFIIKADGAITLEASISYTRTVHANIHYEKNHGLSADLDIDPEAPDALKYSFGPKFEGGFSYGLGTAVVVGLYGKTLALGGSLHVLNKYTISGKLDLAALEGGYMDYLEAMVDPAGAIQGSKWKFLNWEGFMLNQAAVVGFSANMSLLFKDLKPFNVADINIPIDSSPICPQVKIDDKDFYVRSENGKEVTLTLHHVKKSVLDDLTEFRAEFRPVGDKEGNKTITKYFDFDDDKRNLLKAETKNQNIVSNAKVTLSEDEVYSLTVYMKVLGIDIPIFVSESKELGNLKNVDFTSNMTCTLNGESTVGYDYAGLFFDGFGSGISPDRDGFTVTPIGKNGSFKCTGHIDQEYESSYFQKTKRKGTFSFSVNRKNDGSFEKAQDVEWELEETVYHTLYHFTATVKDSGQATDIPVSWTNKAGTSFVWKGTAADGVILKKYSHSCVIVDEKGETKVSYSFDKADEHEIRIGVDFESN